MQQTAIQHLIYNCSLLSSQELKIDDDDNLRISKFSFSKKTSNTIPLDLIEAKPKITQQPDMQLFVFSILSFVASVALYLASTNTNLISGQVIASIFFAFSLLSFVASFKRPTTIYNFFYANTSICLFKLNESKTNNQLVSTFVNQLKQRITEVKEVNPEKNDYKTGFIEETEFTDHLNFLYNHGMLNDVTYEIINNTINEKLYGIKPQQHLADVILLPVKSI